MNYEPNSQAFLSLSPARNPKPVPSPSILSPFQFYLTLPSPSTARARARPEPEHSEPVSALLVGYPNYPSPIFVTMA